MARVGRTGGLGVGGRKDARERADRGCCKADFGNSQVQNVEEPLECPLCGRSAGAMRAGDEWCHRCAATFEPTPLQLWAYATDTRLDELAEYAGVSRRTVMNVARGLRVSIRVARKLAAVTELPIETFTDEDAA